MGQVAGMPIRTGIEDGPVSRVGGLGKRVASTAILLPVFVWVVAAAPPWLYAAMVVLIAARGQWEFSGMFHRAGIPTWRWAGLVGGTLVTASFAEAGLEGPVLTAVPSSDIKRLRIVQATPLIGPLMSRVGLVTEFAVSR